MIACPSCGCLTHELSRVWQVQCQACGELRWPMAINRPDPYTCVRCTAGAGSGMRESRRQASLQGLAKRRAHAPRNTVQP